MTPARTTPDPDCPICFGRGRYDDDGDNWIDCICAPEQFDLPEPSGCDPIAGFDHQPGDNSHGASQQNPGFDQLPCCSDRSGGTLIQTPPINFREPQLNVLLLDERKTQETVN